MTLIERTDIFLKKSKILYPLYDFSKVIYINNYLKVKIICPKHGDFEQRPNDLLKNHGCQKCGRERGGLNQSLTTEEFILRSSAIHNEFYDYSNSIYINQSTKVKIICPKHGDFEILPQNHYNGSKCIKCNNENKKNVFKTTTEEIISKMSKKHNNMFDYSLVNYNGYNQKIKIICPKHGEFEQIWYDHLNSNGCPKCSYENCSYDKIKMYKNNGKGDELGWIYNIKFKNIKYNHCFYKIGITSKSVENRYSGKNYKDFEILEICKIKMSNIDTAKNEKRILDKYKLFKVEPEGFIGYTECITKDINLVENIREFYEYN